LNHWKKKTAVTLEILTLTLCSKQTQTYGIFVIEDRTRCLWFIQSKNEMKKNIYIYIYVLLNVIRKIVEIVIISIKRREREYF
jgi:hypothetical protein